MRSSKENWGSSLFRLLGFRSPLTDSAGKFVLFCRIQGCSSQSFCPLNSEHLRKFIRILGRKILEVMIHSWHSPHEVCGNEPPPFHMRSLTTHCFSCWGQNASAGHGRCGGRYLAGATALFEMNNSGGGRGSVASLICAGAYDWMFPKIMVPPNHPF